MEKLRIYLNGLPKDQRLGFCLRCGTTENYLRKAISVKQVIGSDLCIAIDRESGGTVTCEDIRPDVDWAYLRASKSVTPLVAQPASISFNAIEAS